MKWHVERAIVEAIQPNTRQTRDQLAGLAGVCPKTVDNHLPFLIQAGVVERKGSGKGGSYQYDLHIDKARELGYLA